MRRLIVRLLLAFAIAGLAPAAHAHALTHLGEAHHGESDCDGTPGAPGSHPCETCLSFSAADLGPRSPALPVLGPAPVDGDQPVRAGRLLLSEALTRFASRAPPPVFL